jgi:hypothetical protein
VVTVVSRPTHLESFFLDEAKRFGERVHKPRCAMAAGRRRRSAPAPMAHRGLSACSCNTRRRSTLRHPADVLQGT